LPFPKQVEIELPLLQALDELKGEGRPRDVYPLVTKHFPQLTIEEQEVRFENYPSTRKWNNLVQWVRQRLVDLGQIDGSERGIWRLTEAGRARLLRETQHPASGDSLAKPGNSSGDTPAVSLRDLVNSNVNEIKATILTELKSLKPRSFEHFCRQFLEHLGYRTVEVTRRSQDGGIDG
jgi:restriction system protein